jgi:glutaminyl-tRNA synthetase
MLSKRKLLQLVQRGFVSGWDDPRMPTLCGFRRRGYSAAAIRLFCSRIGVSKTNGVIELGLLEHSLREELNRSSARIMAVLDPVKVVLDNYPDDLTEELDAVNNPEDPAAGTRKVPFSKVLYIEREDFRENPPKQYHRLTVGREVRLRYAYLITCTSVVKDASGEVVEIHCTYDPATRGGNTPDGRKVKSTIHWVPAAQSVDFEARLYESLFDAEQPDAGEDADGAQDFTAHLNPNSLQVRMGKIEPSVRESVPGQRFQFERVGYFCMDRDSTPEKPVFNRTVPLRDTWAKIEKRR